jgi:tetratricopeptide (TPR) repeat protein
MLGDPASPPKVDFVDVDHAIVAAIRRAEDRVREIPASADSWAHLGMVLLAHEFNEAAAACFAQTEILQPEVPQWPFLQATALIPFWPQDAIKPLERAVSLLPPLPTPGELSRSASSSAASDNSAGAASPTTAVATGMRLRLLELYLELGRPQDAQQPLEALLTSDPANGRARLIAARIALQAGRLDECLREVKMAGYAKPAQKPVHELRAAALGRLGRNKEAEAERGFAALAKEIPWPNPFDDEIKSLQTGLKKDLVEANDLYGKGHVEQSADVLKQIVKQYPKSEWAWNLLARAQIKLRRLDEAERSLAKALDIAPNSADAQFRMSVVHMARSNYDEAIRWTQKVLDQKPDHAVALFNMGLYLDKLQRRDEAIDYVRKAVAVEPQYIDAMLMLGDMLAAKGRIDEARKVLEQARDLRPSDTRILLRLRRLPPPNQP